MPVGFDITDDDHYRVIMAAWRTRAATARRMGDEEKERELSQVKQAVKRRRQRLGFRCPDCGGYKSRFAQRCQRCNVRVQFYPNQMNATTPIAEHEIESVLLSIPPRAHCGGVLTNTMRKLALEGVVGDSFVTSKQTTTVKLVAKLLGMQVLTRLITPGKKVPGKKAKVGQQHRVWRSDGKTESELNDIIKRRQAGEKFPVVPCVPPANAEELKAAKHRSTRSTPVSNNSGRK